VTHLGWVVLRRILFGESLAVDSLVPLVCVPLLLVCMYALGVRHGRKES
jgi:hypothetical protein